MKLKNLLLILMLLILIGGSFWLGKNLKNEQFWLFRKIHRPPPLLFPNFSQETIDRLEISQQDKKRVFVKINGEWREENATVSANQENFKEIFETVKSLNRAELVSQNPQKREIFGVDESALKVFMKAKETPVVHFYIGKRGQDFLSNFYRKESEDNVYLSQKLLDQVFLTLLNPQE